MIVTAINGRAERGTVLMIGIEVKKYHQEGSRWKCSDERLMVMWGAMGKEMRKARKNPKFLNCIDEYFGTK